MSEPRPCAILFVDISGSTQLYEQLGDAAALAGIESCLGLLRRATEELGGRVVRSLGDGLLCEFAGAEPALNAARAMQLRVFEQHALGGPALAIHVGCHWGEVIESGGDLYGDAVNVAARVAGLAKNGQIILTQDVATRAPDELRHRVRMLDLVAVKGKREPVEIHELVWQDSEEVTMLGTRITEERLARLRLAYDGRELWFDGSGAKPSLRLGRDSTCDLVIDDLHASRQHATIERRREKYVLVDRSSNGTCVQIAGERALTLRREELILRLRGRIALGHRVDDPQATLIEFACE